MKTKRTFASKKTTALLLGVGASVLSACAINMKPEHQQAYQNFSERRAPVENSAAQSGAYVDAEKKSNFKTFSGYVSGQGVNPQTSTQSTATSQAGVQGTVNQLTEGAAKAVSEATSDGGKSFWDRLKSKFSANTTNTTPTSDIKVAQNSKVIPIENHVEMAQLGVTQIEKIGQGSVGGYTSHYDSANDIIGSAPVYKVEEKKLTSFNFEKAPVPLMLAANASEPLVKVAEPPAKQDIIDKSNEVEEPDLKNVPKSLKDKEQPKAKPTTPSKPGRHGGRVTEKGVSDELAEADQDQENSPKALKEKSKEVKPTSPSKPGRHGGRVTETGTNEELAEAEPFNERPGVRRGRVEKGDLDDRPGVRRGRVEKEKLDDWREEREERKEFREERREHRKDDRHERRKDRGDRMHSAHDNGSIVDQSASLVYIKGQPVVTGVLK